jgi:hypothetical protein
MSFNLEPFINNIATYGTTLNSKYDVSISIPPIMQAQSSNSELAFINTFTQIMPFRAIDCSPPAAALRMNNTNRWGIGPTTSQPYAATFADIRLTLLADTDGVIESFLNYWLNLCYNFSFSSQNQATFLTAFRDDVASAVVNINKYDRDGSLICTYVLTDATPTLFQPSPLSWSATDDLGKFMLQLKYITYDIV